MGLRAFLVGSAAVVEVVVEIVARVVVGVFDCPVTLRAQMEDVVPRNDVLLFLAF